MKIPLRGLRYVVGHVAINAVQIMLSHTPLSVNRFFCDIAFFSFYPLITLLPTYRKTVLDNLSIAFGKELSDREIRRVARRAMRNIFRMPGDILYYGFPKNHAQLARDVTIRGTEHLENALRRGKGVIGLGAHMTAFLLLTVRLANSGIPFIVPTKDPRNSMLRDKLRGWRTTSGVRFIDVDSPDKGKNKITAALDRNELVYLIADERKKRDGLAVPFFGREALTAVGPAVLSLRTGAPIVPIFIAKNERGFDIDIFPPIDNGISEQGKHSVYDLTLSANKVIEDYVRKYPEQWIWTHQRWRF